MDFGFSEEQDLLRGEVRKLVQTRCPLSKVRTLFDLPDHSPELWRDLVEMGLPGLTVPEAYGGAGLSLLDLVVALEETGRGLVPSPLLSTSLAVAALVKGGNPAQQKRWLKPLADGWVGTVALTERTGSLDAAGIALSGKPEGKGFVLSGHKAFVGDAGGADLFIVAFRSGDAAEDISVAVVEKGQGVRGESQKTMDRTKRLGSLTLDGVVVAPEQILGEAHKGWPLVKYLYDRAAVMVAAEAIGSAEAAHQLVVEFAKTRVQFDSVIGRYQGVKHPLAEMYVDIESVKSLTYYAAWVADHRPAELPISASRAKAYVSDAFVRIGIDGIQLHGAIGYTAEYDAQLYMKRAKWVRPAFGDADYHYERVAQLGGL